ncbi:MAG: hypothetical protein GXO54_06820 [Chloroflexi bacterium]|nr:hypothetical protein [Chloroflexota bacterium]
MAPEVGQLVTRVALFIILLALLAVLWAPRGSAAFFVALLSLGVGLLLLLAVAVFARWARG